MLVPQPRFRNRKSSGQTAIRLDRKCFPAGQQQVGSRHSHTFSESACIRIACIKFTTKPTFPQLGI